MARWRLVLEYDGSGFSGWAVQPAQRTVQGTVEEALARLLQHPARLLVSGRTDAGVHALGQVASFDSDARRTPEQVLRGLNRLLPPDVAVLRAQVVDPGFDPRRQARSKLYHYTWVDRPARSPLRRDRAWWFRRPLDHEAMDQGARLLQGTHDFSAFQAAGCDASHAVRTIRSLRVVRERDEVWLLARGHGFLRHMVRIIAGTLTEVGLGARSPEWILGVLESRDRSAAGRTAPSQGLTLVSVDYAEEPADYSSSSS